MGAIGGVVVVLLIRDQFQHRRQIQHGLRQHHLQEQSHLSDAEWEGGVRVLEPVWQCEVRGLPGKMSKIEEDFLGIHMICSLKRRCSTRSATQ